MAKAALFVGSGAPLTGGRRWHKDGESVEVGIVGFEGMAGVSAVLGVDKSPHEMLVQIPDGPMRLSVKASRDEFKRAGSLHDLLLRYTQSLLLQTSQVAACNRLHSVSERLVRWLLMSHDRAESVMRSPISQRHEHR